MFFTGRIQNYLDDSTQECMATNSANPDLVVQPVAQMGDTAEKGPIEPAQLLLSRIFYHAEVAVRLL